MMYWCGVNNWKKTLGLYSTVVGPSYCLAFFAALLTLLCWLLRIETVDVYGWIGIFGALSSQVLIARPAFLFGGQHVWTLDRSIGILSSTISMIGLAVGWLLVAKIGKKVPAIAIVNVTTVEIFFASIPFLIFGYPASIDLNFSKRDGLLYFVVSIGQLHQIFAARSYQLGPPIKAAIISLSRVLLTVGSGALILGEDITLTTGIGGIMMICSVALVLWSRNR